MRVHLSWTQRLNCSNPSSTWLHGGDRKRGFYSNVTLLVFDTWNQMWNSWNQTMQPVCLHPPPPPDSPASLSCDSNNLNNGWRRKNFFSFPPAPSPLSLLTLHKDTQRAGNSASVLIWCEIKSTLERRRSLPGNSTLVQAHLTIPPSMRQHHFHLCAQGYLSRRQAFLEYDDDVYVIVIKRF